MSRLSDLFGRDPRDRPHTAAELDEIVAYFRARRAEPGLFKKDGMPKKLRGKPKPQPDPRQIDLEEAIAASAAETMDGLHE